MARVEEEGQEHDGRPGEAARHVADRRELRRAPEDDQAHRDDLDRREPGFASGQAVDEPEPDRRDGDPERVHEESSSTLGEHGRIDDRFGGLEGGAVGQGIGHGRLA